MELQSGGQTLVDPPKLQTLQYWSFSSADLYNWETNHPLFSEDPQCLTVLVESLMFSHQPTWDDFQQMLEPRLGHYLEADLELVLNQGNLTIKLKQSIAKACSRC